MSQNIDTIPANGSDQGLNNQSPPRRRFMLGAAGAFAAGIVASSAPARAASVSTTANPDAKLIALCARFDALQRQTLSYCNGGANEIEDDDERGDLLSPLSDEQEVLLDQITDLHATTPEGIKARLKMIMLCEPESFESPNSWEDHMITALLKDMTAMQA